MRRNCILLSVAVAVLAGAGVALWHSNLAARPTGGRSSDGAKPSLPLAQVVLFSSGVGYFQREGSVEGDQRIDLSFRAGDINDLLKSLVLQDADGGHVSAVGYDSQEPVEKTLKSFALDLTYNPTVGQLLNQARGEKLEVTLQQAAGGQPAVLTGVIMGMEAKPQTPLGLERVEADVLNLLCAEGLRSVPLTQVQRIRFLNASLDAELRQALAVLASSHDSQKKVVSLNFKGEGKRRVRVGYVVENPIWKTSYRLVLGKERKGGPLLQGWALVENTSDEDWKDVRMVLVSGRPISFQMDLYQPLFVPRPTVEPERFASLRPPTYEGAMAPSQPGLGGIAGLGGFGGIGGGFGVGGGFAGFGGNAGGGGPPGINGGFVQQGGNSDSLKRVVEAMNRPRSVFPEVDEPALTLPSFLDVLARRYGLSFKIDVRAFEAEQFKVLEQGIGERKIREMQNISLASYLSRILDERVPTTSGAVFIVRPETDLPGATYVVEMTTGLFAKRYKEASGPVGNRYQGLVRAGALGNRLTYEELRERELERKEARTKARAVGSSLATLDPGGGVSSVASASEIGDYFRYTIDDKVTLPRQKSAMLPVVNKPVGARRVSIYNEAVHPKFPLLGVRFKNTSGQSLMQGPLTVYEDGSYAGDARVPDLQPGEERLLSYAIDLGSEVKASDKTTPDQLVSVKVAKGIVEATHKLRETRTYTVANRSKTDRTMIVEHPIRADWKLVEPKKPGEQSRDVYRFEVTVPAGKTVQQIVVEEQMRRRQTTLSSTDDRLVKLFLASRVVSPKVKEALRRAVALRDKVAAARRDLGHVEGQLKAITEDQKRLRENIERLPKESDAYKRYLKKFDTQETQIEKLQAQIQQKQEERRKRQAEYEDYLAGLTVE